MKLALCALLLAAALAPRTARAEDAMVRVLSEQAQVHTGPGFGYRVVYVAQRGEVLRAVERATRGYWFRIVLPDGTFGWILGDEVRRGVRNAVFAIARGGGRSATKTAPRRNGSGGRDAA